MSQPELAERFAALLEGGTTEQALALFDELPTVTAEEVLGRWKGSELPTGHPFDGLLAASGWYGKRFDDPNSAHPLLFADDRGEVFAVEPRKVPLSLAGRVPPGAAALARKAIGVLRPLVRTRKPRARLRNLEFRGKVSAAMIYDHLPIIDVFRRVDDATLLGVMDLRGVDQPYFFVLRRDPAG